MKINKDVFYKHMAAQGLSMSDVRVQMDISRSFLWEVLEGKKGAGSKFIAGIMIVFPDVALNSFFLE